MNARGKTQELNEIRNGTLKIISQGRDKYHVRRKGKGGQRGKDRREIKKTEGKGGKEREKEHGGKKTPPSVRQHKKNTHEQSKQRSHRGPRGPVWTSL